MKLSQMQEIAYDNSFGKSFHDMGFRVLRKMNEQKFDNEEIEYITNMIKTSSLALIMTEIGEAIQELRKGNSEAEECSDIAIRLADYAGRWGINLEEEVIMKMGKNEARPKLHNRKF